MTSSRHLFELSIDEDEHRRDVDIPNVIIGRKADTVVTALCRCNVIQSNAIITMIFDNLRQRVSVTMLLEAD